MLTSKPEEFDHDLVGYTIEKHGDVVCHYFEEENKSYLKVCLKITQAIGISKNGSFS